MNALRIEESDLVSEIAPSPSPFRPFPPMGGTLSATTMSVLEVPLIWLGVRPLMPYYVRSRYPSCLVLLTFSATGQCSYNTTLGAWYSLPKSARCPPNSPLGPGCSWRLQKRVKTVEMSCLLENGLFDMCARDMTFPFPRSAALLQKAFSSPLCPHVPPPK